MYWRAERSLAENDRLTFSTFKRFYVVKMSLTQTERADRCIRSVFSLLGLMNYCSCFFFIRFPLLFCPFFATQFFSWSRFCAFLLFWHASPFNRSASTLSSQHLFCLSAERFQAGWHLCEGKGGTHFQHTRCYCIMNSSVALPALALLGRGYFREHLTAL